MSKWWLRLSTIVMVSWSAAAGAQGRTGTQTEAQNTVAQAVSLANEGRYEEAEQLYLKAIRLDPALVEAYEQYSRLLFVKGRHEQGRTLVLQGLTRAPDSDELKAQIGMHLFKLQRFKEAHGYLRRAIKSQAHRFDTQAIISQCCARVEDHPCVVESLQNYFNSRPASLEKQDDAFRVVQAEALSKQNKNASARKVLDEVLRRNAEYIPARITMARVLLELGECARSATEYERLLSDSRLPKDRPPLLQLPLGRAYLCARRPDAALKRAEMVLKKQPQSADALMLQGDAAFELNQHGKALAAYNQVSALTGGAPQVKLRIAQLTFRLGKYAEAMAQVSQLAEKGDAPADALTLGIRAAIRTGKRAEAIRYAERLLSRKDLSADHYCYAGMAYGSSGQFDRAMSTYQKALAQRPDHPGARREMVNVLCYLARAAFRSSGLTEAVSYLKRAQEIDRDSLMVNRNLALVYLTKGEHQLALQRLEVILRRVPQDFVANRLMARALIGLRREKAAQLRTDLAMATVVRLGGIGLARVLGDSAVIRLHQGSLDQAATELEHALRLVRSASKVDPEFIAQLEANFARTQTLQALQLLDRGDAKGAWALLQRAIAAGNRLPPGELTVVQAMGALSAMAAGEISTGVGLLTKLRGRASAALKAPYDKLGDQLLKAYADYLAPSPEGKLKAATLLKAMAAKLPEAAADELLRLAQSALEQAGVRLFAMGKNRPAQQALLSAQKLRREAQPPIQRHNLAVAEYAVGQKESAITAFTTLKAKVPLALCNLAVHHEKAGEMQKAYHLFAQCERKGASYPNIKSIVESKRRVFGEAQKGD